MKGKGTRPMENLNDAETDELISDPSSVRLDIETRRRIARRVSQMKNTTGMKAADLIRLAVIRLLDDMDTAGELVVKLPPKKD